MHNMRITIAVDIPDKPSRNDLFHLHASLAKLTSEMQTEIEHMREVGYGDYFGDVRPRRIGTEWWMKMEGAE